MKLYLLRHAVALDRREWKGSDSDRPLTEDGRRKMKKIARGIAAIRVKPDQIITSPYRRAFDTARLLSTRLEKPPLVRVSRLLTPDGDPKALVRHLALDFRSWESIVLVGHEPYLSRLISVLTTGTPDAAIELKKGGLCLLSADSLMFGPCARLEWLLTSKMLRTLA